MAEKRRVKWTTSSNLNLQFDTWEGALVKLEFASRKRTDKEREISLVFFEGHTDCILNLDETDGALDNNCLQRGGRPRFLFNLDNISGGASRTNKTSYSPTIIAGSAASGDSLQVPFQLNTIAHNESGQKLSINFLTCAKGVIGKF